jgi:tripartite-type tricarboxylate transporter receptor subunit TctC
MSYRMFLAALWSILFALKSVTANAQEFPSRNINFVVPFAAGTATDAVARWLGNKVSQELGRPVIIENIPGANGMIAAREFIKRAPDGYHIFISTQTTHAANPNLYRALPYDPVRDFTPVACLFRLPLVLVVRSSLPIHSIADLVAQARRTPGTLTYGWANSSSRAGGELLKARARVELLDVPYRSAPQIVVDMLGGRVDVFVADPTNALPHIQSGALRALAVTSPERSALFPGVPTMREAGIPGYELVGWYAAFLPAGAPPAVVARLNAAFVNVINGPDYPAFAAQSATEAFTCSPERLASLVVDETENWRRLVEIARIEKE